MGPCCSLCSMSVTLVTFSLVEGGAWILVALLHLAALKDRVGRSGCDLLWVHLNHNISLNLQGKETYDISKNSPF